MESSEKIKAQPHIKTTKTKKSKLMENLNFSTTSTVDQTPKAVFNAVCSPQQWWPGEVQGNAAQLNDEFTYRYKEFHFTRQRVVEIIPDQKVVWLVIESMINYAEDKDEWLGTTINFEISVKDNKTQLRFTHQGLVPAVECFDSCSNSWTQIIQQSLYSLITTGKGKDVLG